MKNQPTKKPVRSARLQALLVQSETVVTTITIGSKFGPKKPLEMGE
jgi:hypothetical protein